MIDVEIFTFNTATHPLQIHYSLSFHTVILLMDICDGICALRKNINNDNRGMVMWHRNTACGTGTRTFII